MVKTCSHLVVATENVPKIAGFWKALLGIGAHFENKEFTEFVLPSGFRLAFFLPTGKTKKFFNAKLERGTVSVGITVGEVDAFFKRLHALEGFSFEVSGPPKEHPWGEKSFLLIDPDGNRWEITESPSETGLLINR